MNSRLDLLLLTDDVHAEDLNRYNRQVRQVFGRFYQELRFTPQDAADVASRYGTEKYLVDVPRYGIEAAAGPVFTALFPHRASLALCDLATVARDAGYSVQIVDNALRYPFRQAQVADIIKQGRPRVIGLSTTFIMWSEAVRDFVALVRDWSPDSKIVVGGPTVRRDAALHSIGDFTVFGSGEEPLLSILQSLSGDVDPDTIPNIAYKDASGAVRYSKGAREATLQIGKAYKAKDGEQIPVPDWSLYARNPDSVYPIEFSRGCKYNCYYCSYDRGKNIRPLDDIRRELIANRERGISKYRFGDSNFTDGPPRHPRYPHDVCKLIAELNLGLQWSCYARADDLTPELAELMKAAGCFAVFFGIESGDDTILKNMRKGHDSADALRGITIAKDAGLFVHCNFIVGYPGETLETHRNSLEFIKRARPDSTTIGHFFVESNAPVMGPKMAQYNLQGAETKWSHNTMDSRTADGLIADALRELQADGITLGSEYEFSYRMALGLSFSDCLDHFKLSTTLLDESADEPARDAARARLREIYLHRIPAEIARDQKFMKSISAHA